MAASLFDLYRGASLPSSLISHLGQTASVVGFGEGLQRRRALLTDAIRHGKIQASQLGSADASLLSGTGLSGGTSPAAVSLGNYNGQGGGGGGVGGFISNLGGDVFNFGKEIVPGIYHVGKAGVEDAIALAENQTNPAGPHHDASHLKREVVDPTVQGYKQTYAGGGGFGGFLHRLYQHPLGPILDAATIATLGAGAAARSGAAVARSAALGDTAVGDFGRQLQRLTAAGPTPGFDVSRRPVDLGNGVQFDRTFSTRPLTKLAQIISDKAVDTAPARFKLQDFRQMRASRQFQRQSYQEMQYEKAAVLRENLPPLETAFRQLSPNESTALHLVLRGVNSDGRLEAFQNLMRNSLENKNPEGHNIEDFGEVDRRHTMALADLPEEVKHLVLNPNENMVNAAEAWAKSVSEGHELLGIDPELHAESVAAPGRTLDDFAATGRVEDGAALKPATATGEPPIPHAEIDHAALPHVRATLESEFGSFEAMKHAFLHEDTHLYEGPWGDAVDNAIKDNEALFDAQPDLYEQAGNDTHHDFVGELQTGTIHNFEQAADYLVNRLQLHLNDYGKSVNETGTLFGGAQEATGASGRIADTLGGKSEPSAKAPLDLNPGAKAVHEALAPNGGLAWGDNFADGVEMALQGWGFHMPHDPEGELSSKIEERVGEKMDERGLQLPPPDNLTNMYGAGMLEADNPFLHGSLIQPDLNAFADVVRETAEEMGLHRPAHIAPNYAPDVDAGGLKWNEPGRVKRALGDKPGYVMHQGDRQLSTGAITAQNLLTTKPPSFERASSGATFDAGAFRIDPKVFLDHVAQRTTHVIDKAYKQSLVNKFAAKGEDAEGHIQDLKFRTPDEVRQRLGNSWVLVHPDFPIAWFRAERNVLKEALNIGRTLVDKGHMPGDPEFENALNTLASADAQAFIRTNWGAIKRPGVAVPRDFYEYQKKLATVNDPFTNGMMRFYTKYINLWRTYTLAYMPRWAINTAVGTFLQAMVHGAVNPKDYLMARRLDKAGELPPGVKMGQAQIAQDIGPPRRGLIERATGGAVRLPTHQLVEGVQAIEDHFRRAMFVQSLKQADKVRLRDIGETVKSWYEKGLDDNTYIRQLVHDPALVKTALKDVNTFAYNYAHLGPFERRYVRQFVPFWGWYKFITKLAWRLPAEYPGRSEVIRALSNVGLDQQDSLGPIPDWLKGLITLNMAGGHLEYLSTVGLNPFSQFANPIAPHGAVNGVLQLGQFSPLIQAVEQAYGLDPLTGDSVRISPQEHVARDILGRLVDVNTGEQVAPSSIDPIPRGLMAILRAFPQFRLAEKYAPTSVGGAGGGSVYPESMPFVHFRPMSPAAPGAAVGVPAELLSMTGLLPKTYDLAKYQQTTADMYRYAKSRNASDLRRLSKKLAGQP